MTRKKKSESPAEFISCTCGRLYKMEERPNACKCGKTYIDRIKEKTIDAKVCPNCSRPGFQAGRKFRWCGVESIQCSICGKDRNQSESIDMGFPFKEVPKKITLPLWYKGGDGKAYELLGWENDDPKSGHIVIRMVDDGGTKLILNAEHTKTLLVKIKVDPDSIPFKKKKKTITISPKDWAAFQRFKETLDDLDSVSCELLSGWRNHLEYIREECGQYDNDDSLDEMDENCRKIPRIVKYIKTGHYLPMDSDDDDLTYYDESITLDEPSYRGVPYRETQFAPLKPKRVHVIIEDISTGDL